MKRLLFFTIIIVCIFTSVGLIGSITTLWQKQDLVKNAQQELDNAQKENRKLKKQLATATSDGFIEEEARNKLLMTKDGEKTVVIPESLLKKPTPEEKQGGKHLNVELWFSLFFGKKE